MGGKNRNKQKQTGAQTMQKLNLMLHCGANEVDRNTIEMTPTPGATDSWHPIPHAELLDRVYSAMDKRNLEIVQEAFALSHEGDRFFGMMQVSNGHDSNDHALVLGVRNSHDKSFPSTFCLGDGVFVCDNLAFAGEIKLARKHTRFIHRDLPSLIYRAVGLLTDHRQKQDERIAAYKTHQLTDVAAHDTVINMMDCRAIPATAIPKVLKEWREPSHDEFQLRTAWSLFNATTEVLKGNLNMLPKRTQALHGLMDSVCGLSV
jgi:hypothetical protein